MRTSLLLWLLLAISVVSTHAQTRTLKGKVTDAHDGQPVPLATIRIAGTNKGTTTDQQGNFLISVESGQSVQISSVGYQTVSIAVKDQTTLSVKLGADQNVLNEYIATGYTNTNRRTRTSAVGEVTAEDMENKNYVDINQALQGQTPGVFVGANSGMPGAIQNVRIRGVGSISAGSSPLYVVDGTIIDGRDINAFGTLGVQSNDLLANINPNDVESITILKDAAATALYGSRGANGVIVITTKKGKSGVSTIGLNAQYGKTQMTRGHAALMTPAEALAYDRDLLALNGYSQAAIDDQFPMSLLDHAFDWGKAGWRKGTNQVLGLTGSGGTEKAKYYASGGYEKVDGPMIGTGMKRYSVMSNVSAKVTDRIDLALNLNLSYTDFNTSGGGNFYSSPILGAYFVSPFQSPYKPDGSMYTGNEPEFDAASSNNFLYSYTRNTNKLNNFRGLGGLTVSYTFTDWLKISEKVNMDLVTGYANLFTDPTTHDGANVSEPLKSGDILNQLVRNTTLTNQLSASGTIPLAKDHSLNYIALMEYNRFNNISFSAEGIGLVSGKLKALDVAATPQDVGGNGTDYTFVSYLGQLNYNFKSRYTLNVTYRKDGSSRFGVNKRFGNFYSVGASWVLIDEPFMQQQKVLSDLRLRGSYGLTGNADFDNFVATALYAYNTSYNGAPGNAPSTIGNKDLTWEKNKASNIGLEAAVLDNRIKLTFDVYKRITYGLLMNTPVSSTSGFTQQQANVGRVQNKGIEAMLTTTNVKTGGFEWQTEVNFSLNRNKILELYGGQDITGSLSIQRVGNHIASWYMYRWAGVDPANGDPLWLTVDDKTTNKIGAANKVISGNAEPRYIGSLTNRLTYKGIGLSFMFYGVTGNKVLNQTRILSDADGAYFGYNYSKQQGQNYWRKPGDNAERPLPKIGGNKNANSATSTRFLENGKFLRLRDITLSYNLPPRLLKHAKIAKAYIFATGTNLITWTGYTGWDPEQDISANEFFRFPPSKTVSLGLNVNF
ncbi:SusC/RagA family TonB-linked outer membrane protein [Chitinophaga sancti]|uniref:TonB-dependent receptor n=1 Tax=Chitinophaga sancti TaxID=1004 RepID=A0A1K1NUT7_9BACT|nr:TonB-dependent receptor [Chitinophaga sancti]WQD60196.1 TonB-dependent receptor [Chitinophaga sancti]WQG87676.1 TonB-dependent receptor [Chitinophaga sancti]SFW39076.1 TonB-linked outer membrane protein, SusC/RagA family [Chitinophaga sancti]